MRAKTMKALDWYAGIPACYLLALYEGIQSLFPRRGGHVRQILVMKFFGLGSIILTAPAIAAIREHYKGAHVHYFTFVSNKPVLDLLGLADTAHYLETKSLGAFIASTVRAIIVLRRAHIDLAFDFEFFAKFPLLMASLSGVRRKAGFALVLEPWRSMLLDCKGYYNHYYHVKDIFLSLVYVAATNDPYYLQFESWIARFHAPHASPGEAARLSVANTLVRLGFTERKLLVINPNAAIDLAPEIKRWPKESFVVVAEHFLKKGSTVILTGAKFEHSYVESILNLIPTALRSFAVNAAGELSLKELLALLELADTFITTDSGPMHLAGLVNAPLVGLFFAETPVLYAPLSNRARVVYPTSYAFPSFTVYTGKEPIITENRLARSVLPAEVIAQVELLLAETQV